MYVGAWVADKSHGSSPMHEEFHVGPHIMIITPHQDEVQSLNRDGSNGEPYVAHLPNQTDVFLVMPIREWGDNNEPHDVEKRQTMTATNVKQNKELVLKAMRGVFIDRDMSLFEKYWAEDYIQHNHYIPPFRKGLRDLASALPPEFTYEPGMIIGEGDLIMIHGRYSAHGPFSKPVIAVDIFRIANGLLVEHWDVLEEEIPAALTISKNAMFSQSTGGGLIAAGSCENVALVASPA